MTQKELYSRVIQRFIDTNAPHDPELHYSDAFSLLVAVILSAQCTDKRVNLVTPNLLKAFPDAKTMSKATENQIFQLIKSVSYPNSKAKHLKGMAEMLISEFGGEVPHDRDTLQRLPGVGRKTANVVLAVIDNAPVMAVDTHVFRVAKRIGLVPQNASLLNTELTLTHNIPAELIPSAHHWFILHGRYVCKAIKPQCATCILNQLCQYNSEQAHKC